MFGLNRYRKKLFVSGRIQGRLLFRIGLYWVLYHVVLWHALFVYRYLQDRMNGAILNESIPFGELYTQFVADYYPVVLCAVITLPIVVIDMLKMTHRIAGPLVAFQNALRELVAGKAVEQVQLRKGDLLTEFQDEFNAYLDTLAKRRRHESPPGGESEEPSDGAEAQIASQVADLRETIQQAISSVDPQPAKTNADD